MIFAGPPSRSLLKGGIGDKARTGMGEGAEKVIKNGERKRCFTYPPVVLKKMKGTDRKKAAPSRLPRAHRLDRASETKDA